MLLIRRRSIASLLGVMLTLLSLRARADEPPYQPKIVPVCKAYQVAGVGWVCGYKDIADWKLVLSADSELVHNREELTQERTKSHDLTLQVEALKGQVAVFKDTQALLVKQNHKLTQDLIDLDEKYQLERVKPTWGTTISWTIAAVAVAVLGGYILADQL